MIHVVTGLSGNPKRDCYFQRINIYHEVQLIGKRDVALDPETEKVHWLDNLKAEESTYFQRKFIENYIKDI